MIPVASNVRIWIATGHTDMRNYAEFWPSGLISTGFFVYGTPHNIGPTSR